MTTAPVVEATGVAKRFGATVALADGRVFDGGLYASIRDEELARLGGAGEGRLAEAVELLDRLVLDDDFAEFLTHRAYSVLE